LKLNTRESNFRLAGVVGNPVSSKSFSNNVMDEMKAEDILAFNNSSVFLKEFTFRNTRFTPSGSTEVEFCDGAIWLADLLVLFQVKSRNLDSIAHSEDAERSWFEKKISKQAVNQLVDTITYLEKQHSLPFLNERQQRIEFSAAKTLQPIKFAIHDNDFLPEDIRNLKGRLSKRIGFVHFLSLRDYRNICLTFHTPMEIADYFLFRQQMYQTLPNINDVSEMAVVGKYISDTDEDKSIDDEHELYVVRMIDDRDDFNINQLLDRFLSNIQENGPDTQYHTILAELALLRRGELKEFRRRFEWMQERSSKPGLYNPCKLRPLAQDCSFVFIPLPNSQVSRADQFLEKYTHACKHLFRTRRCLGMVVLPHKLPDTSYVKWLHLDFEWELNADIEKLIDDLDFRNCRLEALGKYKLM